MRRRLSVLTVAAALLIGGLESRGEPAQSGRTAPSILDFTLEERVPAIVKLLGPPAHSNASSTYRTLDYNLGPVERMDEDFDWTFYFDQPSGSLITVTRNFERPANVAKLLTGPDLHHHTFRDGPTPLSAMTRVMADGRVLVAIGITKPTDPCSQLTLMKRSAVLNFYPWIDRDLR